MLPIKAAKVPVSCANDGAAVGSRTPDLRMTRTPVTAYSMHTTHTPAVKPFTMLNRSVADAARWLLPEACSDINATHSTASC